MVELRESYNSSHSIDEEEGKYPGWEFNRSYDSVGGNKPYRCEL